MWPWNNNVQQGVVYLNDGNGNLTNSSNYGGASDNIAGLSVGDADNDGDLDFLLTGGVSSIKPVAALYKDDGGGGFTVDSSEGGTGEQGAKEQGGDGTGGAFHVWMDYVRKGRGFSRELSADGYSKIGHLVRANSFKSLLIRVGRVRNTDRHGF